MKKARIKENHVITINYDKEKNNVFISDENTSECTYEVYNKRDLKAAVNAYIDAYIQD